ncbi:hypothetical protein ROT00_14455 [Agromyces mediolanus]|uniref:hypothetical protein n=1 Tax=Agromyces mediolanus TaxID=41986 RepID=UPI000AD755F3
MSTDRPTSENRVERILAYMVAGSVGLSVLCIFAVLIATAAGAGADDGFSRGVWPVVFFVPVVGLPLGFLLLVVLLIVNAVRRSREARTGS